MKILYFAWMRERIGHAEEDILVPDGVTTIAELTDHLAGRSPRHAEAFANRRAIKMAIDQRFAPPDTLLGDAREIAFFPPFTGG